MVTVTGTLPVGIEFEGQTHRDYTLRARLVRDSIEAGEEMSGNTSDSRLGLAILVRQIVSLGSIPREEITTEMFLDAYDEDLGELYRADMEVAAKLKGFCSQDQGPATADNGLAQNGVQLPGSTFSA